MFQAYVAQSLNKPPYEIESLSGYDNNIFIGTKTGDIYAYTLNKGDGCFKLEESVNKTLFRKTGISQIEVVPSLDLLLCLSAGVIHVYNLSSLSLICQLHDMLETSKEEPEQILVKGITLFCTNTTVQQSLTGEIRTLLRLVAVVKRKLQLYYFKRDTSEIYFHKLCDHIQISNAPRTMVFHRENICLGYQTEYVMLQLNRESRELFPPSSNRNSEPCIVHTQENTFALCRDNQTILVNAESDTDKLQSIKWTEVPSSLIYDDPYLIAILSNSIEVQAFEAQGLCQRIERIYKAKFATRTQQGTVFIASAQELWLLQSVDLSKQTDVLLKLHQFQLALKLTEISNDDIEIQIEKRHHIQTLLAYDLFKNKKIKESMSEFIKLKTDPYDVIRLFPDMLPQSSVTTKEYQYSDVLKYFSDKEKELGLLALIDYLTEVRRTLQCKNNIQSDDKSTQQVMYGNKDYSYNNQQLLQIIDTTLLKCYLETNDALVAPLIRLGNCHLGESEKILKQYNKLNDLIILYETKRLHRRALESLKDAKNYERTILYLQHLSIEHIGLILEMSDWVLQMKPELGLSIFVEDIAEVEAWPRLRILDFLLKSHTQLVVPYLEHVVNAWQDTQPMFHNTLIHRYVIQAELELDTKDRSASTRRKLRQFLKTSKWYTPSKVLNYFPDAKLLEERAIVLGNMNDHEEVLEIYVHALNNISLAEDYCKEIYINHSDRSMARKVFVYLLKSVLKLSNSTTSSIYPMETGKRDLQIGVTTALDLLERHAEKMEPLEALLLLPDTIPITRIHKFILVALKKSMEERRKMELLKGLLYAEHLQMQELRLKLQGQCVLISESNVCQFCKKRFGNQSALVRYANGDVVHFSCRKEKV